MQIAYFVNQYPKVSHSFIRREIVELETQGMEISRFSISRERTDIVDERDREELAKTIYLAEVGRARIISMLLLTIIKSPLAWLNASLCAATMGMRSRSGLTRHLVYLIEACVLVNLLKEKGIRHIHAHFGTNPAAVALLAHKLCGISYSFTVHGPEEFDKPEALSLDQKIRHASFVVGISSFGRSQLFRWSRFEDWPKIKVVRCGLDAQFLESPKTAVPDNRRIVCVGRLCEQKGQLLLVEAINMLKNDGEMIDLVLAGDGPMRSEIEELVNRLGLAENVRITGWISGSQVLDEIRSSRALVLPSFAEGLPVVLMEACALRRPVVTTHIAGIPELVEDGISGWLVPAGSAEAIRNALEEVLKTSSEVLEEMAENAYGQVSSRHDIRSECSTLRHLFARLAGTC